jgi:hypothetical protein
MLFMAYYAFLLGMTTTMMMMMMMMMMPGSTLNTRVRF